VPRDSDLYERYLATLGQQEDRVETLTAAIQSARETVSNARQALVDYARGLEIPG
jgi:prefoldin subunit 5